MSSNGNALGYVVGAIVGYFTGGTSYILTGAALGGAVGAALDPPKGPNLQGPRLDDLSVQTSTYGVPIPRIYGTLATFGNVFWLENDKLKEVARKKKSGGKGGGGSSVTTYSYFATFAVGLCRGPIAGVRRIWIGSKLIYDAGADDVEAIIASNQAAEGFRVYVGDDAQNPDPRMQADKGINNTPAYRGLAYIVFYDYALADHGNSLMGAQVKVEVAKLSDPTYQLIQTNNKLVTQPIVEPSLPPRVRYLTSEMFVGYVPQWGTGYPPSSSMIRYEGYLSNVWTQSAINIINTTVPPNGTTDDPSESIDKISQLLNVPFDALFYGPSGYFIKRNGITCAVSNTYNRLYIAADGPSSTISIASSARAVCEYNDIVYAIETNAVKTYDKLLNLTDSVTGLSWVGGLEMGESRAFPANGAIYLITRYNNPAIYRIEPDLSSITLVARIFQAFQSYYNTEFSIEGNVLAIARSPVAGQQFIIDYYNLESVSVNLANLSDIVETEMLQSGLITASDVDVSDIAENVRGYRITQVGAIRSAIEPLRSAWPFDVVQAGYQIECKRRGGSSVVTIPASKLDCRAIGTDQGPQLSISREMESQLPRRLQLKYLDTTREYDTGEQSAERINVESVSTTVADLPIVFTPDEAAQKAEILLYLYWMDRRDITFKLPPEYLALEPSDIVTIVTDDASYILRIVGITYTHDWRLECRAKFHDAATYTSDATGDSGSSTGGAVGLAGPTYYELLDIPTVIEDQNTPSFVAVASGVTSGWPGGIIFRSADNGQTWEDLQAFDGKCTFGYARNSLNPAPSSFVDSASVLTVDMINGEIESITEIAMLNGGNLFAYGVNGRWEIISARTVTLNADGSYSMRDMLRGRYGTEWATGLHASGDALVLLNDTDNALIGADSAQIGLSRLYRGITAGRSIDSDSNRQFTYNAVNLEPLSPVYVRGNRHPTTSDWSLFWIRRTRIGGEWRNLVDVSLGESTELYEIDILNGVGQVVRTLTSTTPTVQYTSAQQTADFGGIVTRVEGVIYQISSIVGRGYGAAFDIGLADADPYFSNVVSLMHFDGSDGSTVFADETGKVWSANGNAKISTAQSKFGGASAYFDGNGDYLATPESSGFGFEAGDFTVEAWICPVGILGSDRGILDFRYSGSGAGGTLFLDNSQGGRLAFWNNTAKFGAVGSVPALNQWVHVALSLSEGVLRGFLNGVQQWSASHSKNLGAKSVLGIGGSAGVGLLGTSPFHGYIDEVRITKGVARYTGPFTPPIEPFKGY